LENSHLNLLNSLDLKGWQWRTELNEVVLKYSNANSKDSLPCNDGMDWARLIIRKTQTHTFTPILQHVVVVNLHHSVIQLNTIITKTIFIHFLLNINRTILRIIIDCSLIADDLFDQWI
jgi:hypothetical protein